jgi:diguanylate cyclase (GGDEF)-like protein
MTTRRSKSAAMQKPDYDIFGRERAVIEEARARLAQEQLGGSKERGPYRKLLREYQRLFGMTRRLVQIGDTIAGDQRGSATVDPLTRLPNRARFQQLASQELSRSRRYERPFTLLVIDLDHFKSINDTYGHPGGDAVLRAAAAAMRNSLRGIDVIGRWGGEEFAAMLPETSREGAAILAERLRQMVAATPFEHRSQAISCTVSIGAAALPVAPESLDAAIEVADQAVYRAKASGRNCVVFA